MKLRTVLLAGSVGHVDHGKTTLTAAIAYTAAKEELQELARERGVEVMVVTEAPEAFQATSAPPLAQGMTRQQRRRKEQLHQKEHRRSHEQKARKKGQ